MDFPDDDVCLDLIFKARFGHVKDCPRCGVIDTKFFRVAGRKCYACMHCSYLFSASKNGVAAKELERHLGVTYKTAHRMGHQVCRLMFLAEKIGGRGITVEADETYYGGRRRFSAGPRHKVPVLSVVERDGEVRAQVSDTASMRRAKTFLHENIEFDSTLYSDESKIYLWTKKYGIKHDSVNHARREYARHRVSTNTIEGFWSQLKRSIDGTYHRVSRKYLQLYVDEFTWRYSHRSQAMYPILLGRAALCTIWDGG